MADDGVVEIVLGILFLIGGLATLFIQEIPIICFGAIIFGPILMISGFIKMARAGRRPAYPPQYYAYPPPQYAPPAQYAPPPQAPVPAQGMPATMPPAAKAPGGRTCPACGGALSPVARFCNHCGAALL